MNGVTLMILIVVMMMIVFLGSKLYNDYDGLKHTVTFDYSLEERNRNQRDLEKTWKA